MADKLEGGVVGASTGLKIRFRLFKASDGTEQTGKVAGDMIGSYWRIGGVRVAIFLTDLAAVDSAFSEGGVKEVDATNKPGVYRLDVPNAAIAAGAGDGADSVSISIKVAGCILAEVWLPITTVGVNGANANVLSVKAKTDNLPSALAKNVGVTIPFEMRSAANPSALALGITPTVKISKDNGAFVNSTNVAAEISGLGVFSIALTAAEMNADIVTLHFSGTGAVTYTRTIFTEPV